MGYNLIYLDENGVEQDPELRVSNLTYNYGWWPECKEYWDATRDYDGKTVGEAIQIMEQVTAKMIADGIVYKDFLQFDKVTNKYIALNHLEDLLAWLIDNYTSLIRMPRQWRIRLD